jgi:DNA-binding response OmpR family regulator
MSIMKVTNMTETEQRIKMRHAFAMSSFARMFTPNKLTHEMRALCREWSEIGEQPPQGDLYQVDRYFLELWKTWSSKSAS